MAAGSLLSELSEQLEAAAGWQRRQHRQRRRWRSGAIPCAGGAALPPMPQRTCGVACGFVPAAVPGTASASPASPSAPWRPMFQVDCLNWPEAADRLEAAAGSAIDTWAGAISGMLRPGRTVLGFGSSTSGEGVTTLMLLAARRLAGQGRRVAVVDANLADPKLAQTLGLLPEVGWEASLSAGLPLEEVAVESIKDRLTVVPLLRPPAAGARARNRCGQSADLQTLAQNYDAVLVDLGPLESEAKAPPPPAPPAGVPRDGRAGRPPADGRGPAGP